MAFALVAHATLQAVVGGTTSAVDTTGASLLVACVTDFAANSAAVSDSKGNTWIATPNPPFGLNNFGSADQAELKFFYAKNPTVGTGHTFSFTSNASTFLVSAYSGADTTAPYDTGSQGGGRSGPGSGSAQAGSITPSQANSLIVTVVTPSDSSSGAPTVDSSYTITDSSAYQLGVAEGGGMAYFIQSTATATNPKWSWLTVLQGGSCTTVAFKPAAAAGITGDAAWTEAQDTWAISGQTGVFGSAAWTEGQDSWAISASVRVDGSAAWTEAQDAWAISATVSGGGVTGDAAWVEIQDSWSIAGQTGIFAAAAWTETQDAWNIVATLGVFGTAAWTEGQDAWIISGTVSLPSVTGDAAWTEAQDSWAILASNGLIDTHDGGPKRRKKHEEQKKKEEREARDRQERRRRQMVAAFEQVIEGSVSRETNIEQVIAPAATYAVQTQEIAQKSDFDFAKWLQNLDNAQRILDDYLEADDEEVLVFL